MTSDQQAHLQRILSEFTKDASEKYISGQKEHGGNLWEKPGMLDNAIQEVLDLAVYLYTLREQLERDGVTTRSRLTPCSQPVPDAVEIGT